MTYELIRHPSPEHFLGAAQGFLEKAESANSLPLGLALRTARGDQEEDAGTAFFSLQVHGEVCGAVLQTPGRACVFTAMDPLASSLAARELPGLLPALHGCNGPVEVVDLVAETWGTMDLGELRAHASLRLFELTELRPAQPVVGHLRKATVRDFELCQLWAQRFMIDCGLPGANPDQLPERLHALEEGRLYLWEVDGQPVSSATWARPVASGVTIGFVYTPPEQRGHGYASNVVSGLTEGLLSGALFQPPRQRVTLFTDLANPTSNSIYRKLGYRPIADHRMYQFR